MRLRDLFIDLDGVMADFDGFYEHCFGSRVLRADQTVDEVVMWENIRSLGVRWFEELPVMPGALDFFRECEDRGWRPHILSGLSEEKYPGGEPEKRRWVRRHLGERVPVTVCRSADKCLHGKPGDVLVDDWHKYRHLWEAMGGVFVLHADFDDSFERVRALMEERA